MIEGFCEFLTEEKMLEVCYAEYGSSVSVV